VSDGKALGSGGAGKELLDLCTAAHREAGRCLPPIPRDLIPHFYPFLCCFTFFLSLDSNNLFAFNVLSVLAQFPPFPSLFARIFLAHFYRNSPPQ